MNQPVVIPNNFVEEQKNYFKIEEKRFKSMLDLMLKYRDWEEERIKMQLMQGANSSGVNSVSMSTPVTDDEK